MNIYKEFKRQNPGAKATANAAKLKGEKAGNYAALMLADKAEQTAKACTETGKLEKAIYYYSIAYNWYADAQHPKCPSIDQEIIKLARTLVPPKP